METRTAVAAASSVFEQWAAWPGRDRARVLRRWYDEVLAAREEIAELMTLECGKPLAESRGEFDNGYACRVHDQILLVGKLGKKYCISV